MIDVGIVGVTGYAGEELLNILLRHPYARITHVSAKVNKPKNIAEIFPKFKGKIGLICKEPDIKEIIAKCDLIFLALPHTVSMDIAPRLLSAGKKVIDLSADYRLKDAKIYEQFYKAKHKDKINLAQSVYGLPEIYRVKIKQAKLIANPGCYPTVSILALAPLVAFNLIDLDSIIIDAKSGVTGAGRKVAEDFLFSEANENFKAYKVNIHQHAPEINQELSKIYGKKINPALSIAKVGYPRTRKSGVNVTFVPHLLPLNRGILATEYAKKTQRQKDTKTPGIIDLYKKFYKKEPFVRIRQEGDFPQLKDVVGTNFCDIGIKYEGKNIIVIAAIDNLLKGASGQAVQNMNIMYSFPEYSALL